MAHQMFPAPGVYDALTTELVITVSACTTPLNLLIPAFTVTMPADTSTVDACTVSFALAVTVIPADAISTLLPLLSVMVTLPGPSSSVSDCPPGVSSLRLSRPLVSLSRTMTPLRERSVFFSLRPLLSIDSGGASLPFQRLPNTYGRRGSPASKATSTSSSGSGTNQAPRLLPAMNTPSRAHASYALPEGSGDHGSRTRTRPRPSGSTMWDTSAVYTP